MKIRLGLFFGGKSPEHEVSIQSAKSIYFAINKEKYDVVLIAIDKKGDWFVINEEFMHSQEEVENVSLLVNEENKIALVPINNSNKIINLNSKEFIGTIDVAFSIIHGSIGEDGCLQGFFNVLNIPFVGCDVIGSAVGMDKDVAKRLLIEANIPVAKYVVVDEADTDIGEWLDEIKMLGLPLFVKPANAGSSVGIAKVKDLSELKNAIQNAFKFDSKVIIEEFIKGREIECSVLGNSDLIASTPGEIIANHDFYSYEAKYIDKNGAILKMPADLSDHMVQKVQDLAVKTFKTLCGKGMTRVDMFLTEQNELYVNEVNTLPGFTSVSMYPKLLELNGIGYSELIDKLVMLALELHNEKQEKEKNLKKT